MFIITISDVIQFIIIGSILLLFLICFIMTKWEKWRCKHEDTFENGSCDEICRKCRTNLGFIGRAK